MKKSATNRSNNAFVVHRKISIPAMQRNDCGRVIDNVFSDIKAVEEISMDVDHQAMRITYDATQLDFAQVEKILTDASCPPDAGWWQRYRSGWYRYLDENIQANAKSKGGVCCGSPRHIYVNRHK